VWINANFGKNSIFGIDYFRNLLSQYGKFQTLNTLNKAGGSIAISEFFRFLLLTSRVAVGSGWSGALAVLPFLTKIMFC